MTEESPVNIKIGMSEETTDKAVTAVLDAVSPFTEGLGALGDRIRFFRERSVIKAGQRAKELVDGGDIAPVPPKVLVPWIEGASLEDADDDMMIEMWARLLASSSEDVAPETYRIISILRELSGPYANLFRSIVLSNPSRMQRIHLQFSSVTRLLGTDTKNSLGATLRAKLPLSWGEFAETPDPVIYWLTGCGSLLSELSYLDNEFVELVPPIPEVLTTEGHLAIEVLKSLGLIRDLDLSSRTNHGFIVTGGALLITGLGAALAKTCVPEVVEQIRLDTPQRETRA